MMLRLIFVATVFAAATTFLPAQDKTAAPGGTAEKSAVEAVARRPMAPPTMGVIDLARAFEQCPKWIRLSKELAEFNKRLGEQLDQMQKRASELRATLEVMPDNEERAEKAMQLDLLRQQQVAQSKLAEQRFELERMRSMLQVYDVIELAIAKVAKARGVQVVHRRTEVEPPSDNGKMSPREVQQRFLAFERRQVLFAAPELDLTDDVIKELLVWPDDSATPASGDSGKAPAPTPSSEGK